jgi:hypothetical protein
MKYNEYLSTLWSQLIHRSRWKLNREQFVEAVTIEFSSCLKIIRVQLGFGD